MRIVVLVESLTFGGAERQACVLAGEFKRRGHTVCVATYHRDDFYRSLLEQENVEHRFLGGQGKLSWALNVRRFLRAHRQDAVLAFLPGPSAYAELAGLPRRRWGLVVSERSTGVRNRSMVKTCLHTLADYVTTNSHSARLAIEKRLPRLRPRLITIYNAVQVGPLGSSQQASVESSETVFVVPAGLVRNKNPNGMLRALYALKVSQPSLRVRVDWYGDQKAEPDVVREVQDGITGSGLAGMFRLHSPTGSIHDVMSHADAVVLPSFYEGLPNAVCEGMALGKPILTSDVSDARNLVEDGVNGFLFDPHSPESVANAISRFTALSPEEKTRMGRAGRAKAEVLFDLGTVADHYLRVLEVAAVGKVLRVEHWPEAVPDAAASRHPEPRNPLFGCGIQKAVHSAPKGGSRSSGASGRGH